jgi:hypothetical protein
MWDFNTVLIGLSRREPPADSHFFGLDVGGKATPVEKERALTSSDLVVLLQRGQLSNPDQRILLQSLSDGALFSATVDSYIGFQNGDSPRFLMYFWEVPARGTVWEWLQSTTNETKEFSGCDSLLRWEGGSGDVTEIGLVKGREAWGKRGVCVRLMGSLPCSLYFGHFYDQSSAVLIPKRPEMLEAVWAFCSSSEFNRAVREVDQALKVTNATLGKIRFDLSYWKKVAAQKYPKGLPRPATANASEWLFSGALKGADQPMQVGVARLLGYQWPRQTASSFPDCPAISHDTLKEFTDGDGIVCLPAIHREQPAGHRLRALLGHALPGAEERALLASAGPRGSKASTLEEWLRDEFFEQHCEIFHQRPFVWHIWDGRKDGFHVLVNYHKLDHAALQKLTYSYLGDWIRQQQADVKAEKPSAELRLGAARELQSKLAKILEGEAPYDIFVRWKPIAKQARGWRPDLNDGVRMNIRPFVLADILRKRVKIKWEKDRGAEPERDKNEFPWFWCEKEPTDDPRPGRKFAGQRWNNVHLTLDYKRAAGGNGKP